MMSLFNPLKETDLILGSQSPRRQELLRFAGFNFRILTISTSEQFPDGMDPFRVAGFLSQKKANAMKYLLNPDSVLITADTIVVQDNQILNKAADADDAFRMLSMLNGRYHNVITGVSITSTARQETFQETTRVYFRALDDDEIWYYINNYKPFDKAGAYGIQEWIGMTGVEKIEGCFYNVMGLPVGALYQQLKSFLQQQFH